MIESGIIKEEPLVVAVLVIEFADRLFRAGADDSDDHAPTKASCGRAFCGRVDICSEVLGGCSAGVPV